MIRIIYVSICLLLLSTTSVGQSKKRKTGAYIKHVKELTDIMVDDVTSPVAAARYYAYSNMAAYETLVALYPQKYASLMGYLRYNTSLTYLPSNEKSNKSDKLINLALLKTGQKLLPSGSRLNIKIASLEQDLNTTQVALVDTIVHQIMVWAKADGFSTLNNLPRYTPKRAPGYWKPTAPAFMSAIEPHWNTIKTLVMDSAQQFVPLRHHPFDLDTTSMFYDQLYQVYHTSKSLTQEQKNIANFWDCNPYAISQIGHIEFGIKKISPGAHWIGIAGIACQNKKFSWEKTVLVHTLLSIGMHDAFIACWDEKYRSDRVRPETLINQYIESGWRPLLQTPPFPEYISGHSVVSNASSTILTEIFGDRFKFTDDTEVEYGLPKRKFKSFQHAADEASISRFYGGIHYMDGIENGVWQGNEVSKYIIQHLKPFFNLK